MSGGPHNVTTEFYFIFNTKFNQNLPMFLSRLTCQTHDFENLCYFECDVIMPRHCGFTVVVLDTMVYSYWQLATATAELTLLTTWLYCGKRVVRKSLSAGSQANYGQYLELPNHGIKTTPIALSWYIVLILADSIKVHPRKPDAYGFFSNSILGRTGIHLMLRYFVSSYPTLPEI